MVTKNKKQYKLNLNSRVTIFVKGNHKHKLPSYFAGSNKNKDGSYTTELWNIMYIFGKDLYNGCDVPFINNEIIIPAEDLKAKEDTFICPWCDEEKPISSKCSKGYCISCSSFDI